MLRDAVPAAFEAAKSDYLAEIDARAPVLEQVFSDTLNSGFRGIYLSTMTAALLAGALLLLHPRRRRQSSEDTAPNEPERESIRA